MNATVICDRCKKQVDGILTDKMTAGFYNVKEGSEWAKFASPQEEVICDDCMQNDYRYRSVYKNEPIVSMDEFINEMLKIGGIEILMRKTLVGANYTVGLLDCDDKGNYDGILAEGKGKSIEYAINDAYLQYLRNINRH